MSFEPPVWQATSTPPELVDNDIHLWRAFTRLPHEQILRLQLHLVADEIHRADTMKSVTSRERFIVARALLRTILALYTGLPSEDLRFQYGPYGKPGLQPLLSYQTVEFNLSHSGDYALYAVSRQRGLGVDIEEIRDSIPFLSLAERFFTRREVDTLLSMPASRRLEAFYRCWTRKEAVAKAMGVGWSLPFDGVEVSGLSEAVPFLFTQAGYPDAAARWELYDLHPAEEYVAALVAPSQPRTLRFLHWSVP